MAPASWRARSTAEEGAFAWKRSFELQVSRTVLHKSPLTSVHALRSFPFNSFEPRKIRATFDHRCPSVAYLNEVLPIIIEVTNHESFPITVSLDALLHPLATQTAETNDTLCLEDQPSSTSDGQRATTSTSSAELAKSLAPGQTATKKIILTSFGTPGPRHIELSAICKPAATTADIEQVATTELSKQLSVDVVHPFFCDFQPAFYQSTPSPKKTDVSFDVVSEPPELSHSWQDAKRCLLNVSLGALGPMQLELLGVKLDLEVSVRF